jgi:large subunit ribosomal protein L10
MAFKDKVDTADQLATLLQESKGAVVVDYRGLTVADINALRRRLREQNVELRVAKNTLLRRVAAASNVIEVDELFVGPTAIASSTEDEVSAARLMAEAARVPRTPLSIKGGVYGGRGVGADQVRMIAELPGRDVMLARAVGATQASATAVLSVIQVLNAVTALQTQREASGPSD